MGRSMAQLEAVRGALDHVYHHQLKVVEKLVAKVKPEDVHYKPCGHQPSLSLGELVAHMYEMVFAYSKATVKGSLEEADFAEVPAPKYGASLEAVKAYMAQVKAFFKGVIDQLTEAQLAQTVTYTCWHGFELTGIASLMTIQEEVVHHRGQLTLYLRLLGYELPVGFIYDYS
jgi:uncharacterized damage-inducible protein DinB